MATSHFHQIPLVMPYIEMLRPKSILDVGAGLGKWGFLLRDRLEFLEGRYRREAWETTIYGVEVCAEYRNPMWELFYDRLWVADILDCLDEIPSVDLVLLADAIEHLPKNKGREVLTRLAGKAKFLLISSPKRFFQGEHDFNPASAHQSYWDTDDFAGMRVVTEEQHDTRVFLIDVHSREPGLFTVNAAERNDFSSLWRASLFKLLRKLGLHTGRCVSPRDLGRLIRNE